MSDNRVRVWFSLFVLAVFCVGLTAGMLIGRRMPGSVPPFDRFDRMPGPGGMRGRGPGGPPPAVLLDRLNSELQLTPDQRTAIERVLRESRDRVNALQRDVHGRFEREQTALRDEIRKLLNAEQQQKFDRWVEQAPRGRGPGPGIREPIR